MKSVEKREDEVSVLRESGADVEQEVLDVFFGHWAIEFRSATWEQPREGTTKNLSDIGVFVCGIFDVGDFDLC